MSRVLVTGGSGYLGSHVVAALLNEGREVRATVRSERPLADGVEVVTADLASDDGWAQALDGVEEVHHVASPFPLAQPEDPDDLIVPAREGTLRVLNAARDAGARRVVLTSSFAAVGYSPKPERVFAEDDWTDGDDTSLAPYVRSKAIAERAAWDADLGDTELVVVNPTFILGPPLTPQRSASLTMLEAMIAGTLPPLPPQRFGIVDVRDVATAHLLAMATPQARGKRYLLLADGPTLTWGEVAQAIGAKDPAPGDAPPPLTIRNDRAKDELGWRPRDARLTITETADSLRR